MMLPTILLASVLQAAPQEPSVQPPPSPAPKPKEAPPATQAPAPATAASKPAASASSLVEAGLRAYRRRQYGQAEKEFQAATEADPQSAAAWFYLGYTTYKIVEPMRPFHPDKQKAAGYFAKAYALDPNFKPAW